MNSGATLDRVRQYLDENFLYMRTDVILREDDSLLGGGVIDSMGVMEIVAFLESEFGIEVEDADVTEDNLGSLGAIARYVDAKVTSDQAA
jgi:acyl carrier protein